MNFGGTLVLGLKGKLFVLEDIEKLAWRDVEPSGPFSDLGVLMPPDGYISVQYNTSPLVSHAKLVSVHRHAGDPWDAEIEGRNFVATLPFSEPLRIPYNSRVAPITFLVVVVSSVGMKRKVV